MSQHFSNQHSASFVERFEIIESLGTGGFASVYLAKDTSFLDRHVALKILNTPEAYLMSQDEKDILAKLSEHPHIVTLHDVGYFNENPCLVLQYAPGGTLSTRISHLHLNQVLNDIVRPLLDALHAAHQKNILHLDIKPENILFDSEDRLLLGDFGIAKILKRKGTRKLLGLSDQYASPEQIKAWQGTEALIDNRADQFSIGIVWYECLTGQHPFAGHPSRMPYMSDEAYGILHHEARPPSEMNANVPEWLDPILLRCLEKDVQKRYGSIAELQHALEEAIEQDHRTIPLNPSPVSPLISVNPPRSKKRIYLLLTLLFIVACGLMVSALYKADLVEGLAPWCTSQNEHLTGCGQADRVDEPVINHYPSRKQALEMYHLAPGNYGNRLIRRMLTSKESGWDVILELGPRN